MAEITKPNLYQKLLSITEAVGKIEKSGKNEVQNYAFTEYSQVVASVRVELANTGVIIIPETTSRTIERYTTMKPGYNGAPAKEQASFHINVRSRYTIINADKPEERFACEWDGGEALDTSDKATNKATTASHKSFLMKLFNISDKDDPDAHSPEAPLKDINYDKSPEEPSRQVGDEPISSQSMEKVKLNMRAKNLTGPKAVEFVDFIIGKPAPSTEADAAELLKALESK